MDEGTPLPSGDAAAWTMPRMNASARPDASLSPHCTAAAAVAMPARAAAPVPSTELTAAIQSFLQSLTPSLGYLSVR